MAGNEAWRPVRFNHEEAAVAAPPRRPRRRRRRSSPMVLLGGFAMLGIAGSLGFLIHQHFSSLVAEYRLRTSGTAPTASHPVRAVKPPPADAMKIQAMRSQTAWRVLEGFVAEKEPAGWCRWTYEGDAVRNRFDEMLEKGGALEGGLPAASMFRPVGRERTDFPEDHAVFCYETVVGREAGAAGRRFLVAVVARDGRMVVGGRLFWEVAADRFGSFLRSVGDPAGKRDLLVRVRRSQTDGFAIDPVDPVAELVPPAAEEPAVPVTIPAASPLGKLVRALGPGESMSATLVVGRETSDPKRWRFIEAVSVGWSGLDEVPIAAVAPRAAWGDDLVPNQKARAALARFLEGSGDVRLAMVKGAEGVRLLRELETAYGPPQATGRPELVQRLPRTLDRVGLAAFRLAARPVDGQGVSVAYMVPDGGDFKLDGALFAQAYYGLFRKFASRGLPGPVELRGVVTRTGPPDRAGILFRDPHSPATLGFDLPADSPALTALRRLKPDESRHATLRLSWKDAGDGQARIALDEWACWGYRGIDDQAF